MPELSTPPEPSDQDVAGSVPEPAVEPVVPETVPVARPAGTGTAARVLAGLQVDHSHPDAVVVTVTGAIDEASVERFHELLAQRLTATVRTVVVDLTGVDFLGVPGLQVLTQAHLRAQARGVAVRVVAAGHEVPHALHMAGLDQLVACFATVAEALQDRGEHHRRHA